MIKYIITAMVGTFFLTGCAFSAKDATKDIKPVTNKSEINEICIYQPETSFLDYDDASKVISNKLDTLKIKHKVVDKDALDGCKFKLSYSVKKAGIPPYLANAFFIVEKDEQEIGHAKYYYNVSGFTITSERTKGTDEKIDELIDSLFEADK